MRDCLMGVVAVIRQHVLFGISLKSTPIKSTILYFIELQNYDSTHAYQGRYLIVFLSTALNYDELDSIKLKIGGF